MALIDREVDEVRALGHGISSLFVAGFLLAIIAVVLAQGSQTATLLKTLFGFVGWMVGQLITPLQPGTNVDLSSTTDQAKEAYATNPAVGGLSIAGTGSSSGTPSVTVQSLGGATPAVTSPQVQSDVNAILQGMQQAGGGGT